MVVNVQLTKQSELRTRERRKRTEQKGRKRKMRVVRER